MKINEEAAMKGTLLLRVYDAGNNLVEEYEERNLIVNAGKASMANLLSSGSAVKRITKIGFGTDGTAPSSGDTGLTSSFVKNVDSYSYPDSTSVVFAWSLGYTEANGKAIQEFGLISNDNTLFARRTRATINKTSDLRLEGTWKIQL